MAIKTYYSIIEVSNKDSVSEVSSESDSSSELVKYEISPFKSTASYLPSNNVSKYSFTASVERVEEIVSGQLSS